MFTPAFRRNARWSVDPKVPDVGDESSTWEEVSAFYDFWYGFKSWREFPHPGELPQAADVFPYTRCGGLAWVGPSFWHVIYDIMVSVQGAVLDSNALRGQVI